MRHASPSNREMIGGFAPGFAAITSWRLSSAKKLYAVFGALGRPDLAARAAVRSAVAAARAAIRSDRSTFSTLIALGSSSPDAGDTTAGDTTAAASAANAGTPASGKYFCPVTFSIYLMRKYLPSAFAT